MVSRLRSAGRWSRSLAFKLYCIAALAVLLVAVLGAAAIHFAERTGQEAARLHAYAMTNVVAASEVARLVAQHRRLVEGVHAGQGPAQIDLDRKSAEDVARSIAIAVAGEADPLLRLIAGKIPLFVERGRRVFALATVPASDELGGAIEAYSRLATQMQDQIAVQREERLTRARRHVGQLLDGGKQMARLFMVTAAVAVLLIGPLSLLIVHSIASRLRRTIDTMRRLAANDTAVAVPSSGDRDEIGEMARAVAVFKANAIALKHQSAQIEMLNSWFGIALNNMTRGLSLFDADERLIVSNKRYAEMYGLPEALLARGTAFSDIIAYSCEQSALAGQVLDAGTIEQWRLAHRAAVAHGVEFSTTHRIKDRVYTINCQPLDGGGWVDVHEEVTEKLRSEQRMAELASFDTLTGLANRHQFQELLQDAFRGLGPDGSLAILWIDLDRFKEVNDTFGHPAGDALLCRVAERLRASIRASDFVSRLGGDEFAIIMRGPGAGRAAAASLARRLCDVVSEPCDVFGHPVNVGASIGIALAPEDGGTPDTLMKNADIALYRAKENGRGGFVFFSRELERSAQERRNLENDLRSAVAAGQLALNFQPIVEIGCGRVTACEALLRWTHPRHGPVSPAIFIPIAEETGLIGMIGDWVLHEACRTAARWPEHVSVAVNLSVAQFASTDVLAVVMSALQDSGLSPRRLQIEVTETLLLKDEPKTRETLHDLKLLGVSIALDDFGTGYSSLSYLRSFPFDTIKIDQTFVRDLTESAGSLAIVQTVAQLARTLGMRTVAEGVETKAHLDLVIAAGCDKAQGYLFSRPVSAEAVLGAIGDCRLDAA